MNERKLYAERDAYALEPHYSRHVSAMTAEQLHSKADIAAELAWRDQRLERVRAWVEAAIERESSRVGALYDGGAVEAYGSVLRYLDGGEQ